MYEQGKECYDIENLVKEAEFSGHYPVHCAIISLLDAIERLADTIMSLDYHDGVERPRRIGRLVNRQLPGGPWFRDTISLIKTFVGDDMNARCLSGVTHSGFYEETPFDDDEDEVLEMME